MKLIIQSVIILFIIGSEVNKAQSTYPINIEFNYLNHRTILISGTQFNTNQVAIKSSKGIILIDTGISPEYAIIVKDSLKKLFKEDDFAYIINTHYHWDHSQGNQIFSEAPIIAHVNCELAMNKQASTTIPVIESSIMENNNQIMDSIPPPPPSHILTNGEGGFRLTTPTIAFSDYLNVKSGDITLHLIYYGQGHTTNDILIYIPEVELLAVGDLFYKKSLPQFSKHNKLEVERWISSLRFVLEEGKSIKYVISGHDEIFSKKELEQYSDYINTMWEGIKSEVAIDNSLEETKRKFNLVNKFPELIEKDMKSQSGSSVHYGNIETFWNIFYNEKHE
jgi:glyoxylase-like metal-dependent hydrolase (beta-lactamase superfamily II)